MCRLSERCSLRCFCRMTIELWEFSPSALRNFTQRIPAANGFAVKTFSFRSGICVASSSHCNAVNNSDCTRATQTSSELSKPSRTLVRKLFFSEKVLDRITGSVLYKKGCAILGIAHCEEKLSMLTSWTSKEHTAKPTHCAGMRGVCLPSRLSLASVKMGVNNFGGGLGQRQAESIDSRHIRH